MSSIFTQANLNSYREQWSVVEMLARLRSFQFMTSGGVLVSTPEPPNEVFNLPVVLAFSLLDEVLGDLGYDGMLAKKMQCSKNALAWIAYEAIVQARKRRNELAHKGILMKKVDCLHFIQLIGAELRSFRAL